MLRLCSGSVTRANILENAGIAFTQSPVDFDEERIEAKVPDSFVYQAAVGKYKAAMDQYDLSLPLLVADTVVTASRKILRKARDEDHARRILAEQSGNVVSIITCTIYKSASMEVMDLSSTLYRFSPFDPEDIDAYMESGEWRGKAGACMVEGFCKKYIESVRGLQSCAMGLTVEKIIPFAGIKAKKGITL